MKAETLHTASQHITSHSIESFGGRHTILILYPFGKPRTWASGVYPEAQAVL